MVNLLRDAPMDVKVHQLVSAQDLAQDGHLPPPAVAQSACGLVFSGHAVLNLYLSKEFPSAVVQLEGLTKVILSDFGVRVVNYRA